MSINSYLIKLKENYRFILFFSILLFIIYFPVFLQLSNPPMGLWDESRYAVNALEMSHRGNPIVMHYMGQPDMWNTKPPLMIWLQALGIALLGSGELAVRLPAALAGLFSCLILFFFCLKYFKSYWPGFASVITLITAQGYLLDHGCRSGNTDCLLGFFMFLYVMAFYVFLNSENPNIKKRSYFIFFIGLLLATYTKGIAAFFYLPSLFLYMVLKKKSGLVFKNKSTYIFTASVILLVAGYYILREKMNPGYLDAVYKGELFSRFNQSIEGHKGNFWWYYNHLRDYQFSYFFLLIIPGFLVGLFSKNVRIKEFSLFIFINFICFYLLLSIGKSKTEWYHLPLYPLLALSVGIFIWWLVESINRIEAFHFQQKYKLAGLFLFIFIFISPYEKTIDKIYFPKPVDDYEYQLISAGEYFQKALRKNNNINFYLFALRGENQQFRFYTEAMRYKGQYITICNDDSFQRGSRVIAYQYEVKSNIESKYDVRLLDEYKSVRVYQILNLKKPAGN